MSNVIRYSTRIGGRVTSLSLNKNIVSLYLTMNECTTGIHDFMLEAINDMMGDWDGHSGKKLSEFVSTQLIISILDRPDKQLFHTIKEGL